MFYGVGVMFGVVCIIMNEFDVGRMVVLLDVIGAQVIDGGIDYLFKGMVNIFVSEIFVLCVIGYYMCNVGFIDNVFIGKDNYNSDKVYGGCLVVKWEVSDWLIICGNVFYQKLKVNGCLFEFVVGDLEIFVVVVLGENIMIMCDCQVVKFIFDLFDDWFLIVNGVVEYDFGGLELMFFIFYFNCCYVN